MSDYPIRQPLKPADRPIDLEKPGDAPENAPPVETAP